MGVLVLIICLGGIIYILFHLSGYIAYGGHYPPPRGEDVEARRLEDAAQCERDADMREYTRRGLGDVRPNV